MTDNELNKYILKQIQLEGNLSDFELKEFKNEIKWISQKDILSWLNEEIKNIEELELRKVLIKSFEELSEDMKVEKFIWKIDSIYEKIDSYYENNLWITDYNNDFNDFPESYSDFNNDDFFIWFKEDKKDILKGLNEELNISSNENIKKQIILSISVLKNITDEDSFYDLLYKEYNKLDKLYDKYFSDENTLWIVWEMDWNFEFNFNSTKKDIINELQEEFNLISDIKLKNNLLTKLVDIKGILDKNDFFSAVNMIYNNEELNNYYSNIWIKLLDDEKFDFDTEREDIITNLEIEIYELGNEKLKKEIRIKMIELKKENEQVFFLDKLDEIYTELDAEKGIYWVWLGY